MGKPTGFIEYLRELPVDRAPLERVRDWNEFHFHMAEEKLRVQGARCMDCGVPFCHTGTLISGMASGCPINNLIPEWNDLVYRGLWKEALERLHKTNNFPEFTGRVCPAPCEGSCVLGINAPPVTIKNIECAIIDQGWDEGWIKPEPPAKRTGKKVAVIGSGPAGLCAAAQLNQAGHSVTVFERADRPGGLLMYGIPNMKLDKETVVLRRIKLMEAEGIKFVCNTEVGKDLAAEKLLKDFDAIVLCTGATKPRDLPIEGRELKGIHFAMDFLTANTKSILDATRTATSSPPKARTSSSSAAATPAPTASAPRCATAATASCKSRFCRNRRWIARSDNPWPEWPKVYKLDYGQEEAAAKFGDDPRVYLTTATKFEGDENGHVNAVHTVQVEVGEERQGPVHPEEYSRHASACFPRNSSCSPWASSGPNNRCSTPSVSSATRAATSKPTTANTPRASRESSPPAIAAAAKASSCGPSTKAAAPRASATVT